MDALILWGFEQAHVHLFGGSPMATDFWNVVYIVFTSLFFTIVLFIPHNIAALVLSCCFGYFLSTDLSNLCRNVALHIWPSKFKKTEQEEQMEMMGFFWTYGPLEFCLIYFIMLLLGGLTALVNVFIVGGEKSSVSSYLGYVVIGLWAVQLICAEIQKITIFGGFLRNLLYPSSTQRITSFVSSKKKLFIAGVIRRIVVNFIGPFVMVAYLSMEIDWAGKELPWEYEHNNTVRFWDVMATSRSYRWIFQSTPMAFLEISVGHILRVCLSNDNSWMLLPLATQLLIIGIIRDRLSLLINKLYFISSLLITNWTEKKQRRKSTVFMIIINIILAPFLLIVVLLSVGLASPLLPLFTLPMFLLGFPRPLRSWPGEVGLSANVCEDTVYYSQAMPEIARAFRTASANGSLGDTSPNRHYLVRWQDRVVWIQVLERGYFYVKLSIKGLELQETSCHTEEAARIDDMVQYFYEKEERQICCSSSLRNKYPLTVLRPYDASLVTTYSDARNKLTGVLDSPQTLKTLGGENFLKCLTWVIVGQAYWNHRKSAEGNVDFDQYDYYHDDSRASSVVSVKKLTSTTTNSINVKNTDLEKDSQKVSSNYDMKMHPLIDDNEESLDELLEELNTFGTPARDSETVMKPERKRTLSPRNGLPIKAGLQSFEAVSESSYSKYLSLPKKWKEMPVDPVKLSFREFPISWYKYIVSFLKFKSVDGKNSEEVAHEIANDETLMKKFVDVIIGCQAAVNVLGLDRDYSATGMSHVLTVYNGKLPHCDLSDWIEDNTDIYSLVIQAYRMAVKLTIDSVVIGEASDLEELHEYLNSYDRDWYIGRQDDNGWKDAVKYEKSHLFALSYDETKKEYESRTLSLQDTPVYHFSVNTESVRAQWANLNLELLYMTNDDDERYSIQAHPALLRNMTVQAADPPLGYPIYSSQPVAVPTL